MQRWMIFLVALLVRAAIAFLFFGSVDVTNSLLDVEYLLLGIRPSELTAPYFPGVQAMIWAAGVIGFHAPLPVTFLYKFFGCLFDAVIAAAAFDYRGRRAGWLYAFAPVPILIVAIHGQWDSISIALFIAALLALRKRGALPAFCAGALYVMAVVAKPIVVPFAIFLLPRGERNRIIALFGGMAAAFAAYLAVLRAIGDPLTVHTVLWVLDYARTGVTYLGLPHALGIHQNRLLALLPILVLLPLYWTGRIERETAVMLAYAFIIGTCGLGAQYLFWIVPFLFICGALRYAALYTILAGLFLVTFYVSPLGGLDGVNFGNLGAFAPLRSVAWLTPAIADVQERFLLLRIVGGYAIPLSAIAFVAVRLFHTGRSVEERRVTPERASFAPLAVALGLTVCLVAVAASLSRPTADDFVARVRVQARAYNTTYHIPPNDPRLRHWRVPAGEEKHPFDATKLALLWVASWSVAAFREARGSVGT